MAYRLLIVDDSPAMRAFVRRVIGLSGFDMTACFEASNGQEALELLRREWVEAILTDINMPCMDGEEFLRQLAANEVLRSIPVIVISTDGTHHRKQRLLAIGARGYLTKPFLPETLRVELESMLGVLA
jgi:two-component system, chemotaxis family, chemotaxis protein CheY